MSLCTHLQTAVASTADVERIFFIIRPRSRSSCETSWETGMPQNRHYSFKDQISSSSQTWRVAPLSMLLLILTDMSDLSTYRVNKLDTNNFRIRSFANKFRNNCIFPISYIFYLCSHNLCAYTLPTCWRSLASLLWTTTKYFRCKFYAVLQKP